MTTVIAVPALERGVVRVFALSMTDVEAKGLKETPVALFEALGADRLLDTDHIELFPVSDLEGLGLAGYLAEGAGIPETDLAADKAKLEKLGGWILVVFSLAFEDRATQLRPASALTLIGTYGEGRTDWRAADAPTPETAKPFSGAADPAKKRPSDAALSGRVATLVLLALALFTYLFIRMAG